MPRCSIRHAAQLAGLARTAPIFTARRTLAGVGVGLYLPLDFLAGAPLIVRYGEGLRVPDGSPEGERREVLLVLAGGF